MDLAEEGEILLRKWEVGKERASWGQAPTVKHSGTCQQVVKPKVAWSQSWWKYHTMSISKHYKLGLSPRAQHHSCEENQGFIPSGTLRANESRSLQGVVWAFMPTRCPGWRAVLCRSSDGDTEEKGEKNLTRNLVNWGQCWKCPLNLRSGLLLHDTGKKKGDETKEWPFPWLLSLNILLLLLSLPDPFISLWDRVSL